MVNDCALKSFKDGKKEKGMSMNHYIINKLDYSKMLEAYKVFHESMTEITQDRNKSKDSMKDEVMILGLCSMVFNKETFSEL